MNTGFDVVVNIFQKKDDGPEMSRRLKVSRSGPSCSHSIEINLTHDYYIYWFIIFSHFSNEKADFQLHKCQDLLLSLVAHIHCLWFGLIVRSNKQF